MKADSNSVLGRSRIVAFVAARDAARAKTFYRDTLGLRCVSEDQFAVCFDAHGTPLRVSIVREMTPAAHTVLGWEVDDIVAAAGQLAKSGIRFERYDMLPQDGLGIWAAPGGGRVAWFKDPDGNTLSITQPAEASR